MRRHWARTSAGAAIGVVLGTAAAACAHAPKPPEAAQAPSKSARLAPLPPSVRPPTSEPVPRDEAAPGGSEDGDSDEADAELVISREVIQHCPTLRLVRAHLGEFDPDMVWLAVLESIADCMSEGGPMADRNLGVSGDEMHRHVVREVLGARGVAPTRVVATPTAVPPGAAECQGGQCLKRVEITVVVP